MKSSARRFVAASIVLAGLLGAARPVFAQEKAPGELALLLGIMRLDRDAVGPNEDPAYPALIGLRLGANTHRPVGYFFEALHSSFETSLLSDNSRILEMRAGVERYFDPKSSNLGWYLAGALGYADVDQGAGAEDYGRPLVSGGIGIRSVADTGIRWRLELREEVWLGDDGLNGKDVANTQVLLGLGFGLRSKEQDSDGDGVPDRIDRCPDTPRGTKVDSQGCPEKRKALFEKGKRTLVLLGVNFITDSAELTPKSRDILDDVAASLVDWPEVRVEIAGHTDAVAEDSYNLDLSQRRAESVRLYLVSKGVDASRLEAKGYGETKPIATNDTVEGRAKNRRVELNRID